MATDVAYRLNTSLPVKKSGTVVVNTGGLTGLVPTGSGGMYYNNDNTKTIVNEVPAATGLANRFDDPQYYTA
jgi:hypothetical protein